MFGSNRRALSGIHLLVAFLGDAEQVGAGLVEHSPLKHCVTEIHETHNGVIFNGHEYSCLASVRQCDSAITDK